ncbi:hypothetical protein KIW84_054076 [Lathyrus oleraceus]|uniref:Chromo domain-containing protein n=1 Tax=Pisum sativum TaxID=3888 RepID=A0A9D5AH07_PEA|nr:hypothetical protein KIW84_054076 [Pisum sativum]
MDWPIEQTPQMKVKLGNGVQIEAQGRCKELEMYIGSYKLRSNLQLFELGGIDVVLGVEWLKTLGDTIINWKQHTMSFWEQGKWITLGNKEGCKMPLIALQSILEKPRSKKDGEVWRTEGVEPKVVCEFVRSESLNPELEWLSGEFANIFETTCEFVLSEHQHQELGEVLGKYAHIFQTPSSLPPRRKKEHDINPIDGHGIMNVRPYRYPHHHKNEIERQVKEMLAAGIIRHSTSSFSSPVILTRPAFDTLKQRLTTTPVLALPDFSKEFVIKCDASGTGIWAILMQDKKPVAYFSKALGIRNLSKSAYEKELMVVVLAIQHWRPYLLGRKFVVSTDQRSLKQLMQQKIAQEEQIKAEVQEDEKLQRIIAEIQQDPSSWPGYSYRQGVLFYEDRTWVTWIHWVEYWYNTTYHASTGKTPFGVVYGRLPPRLTRWVQGETRVASVQHDLMDRDEALKQLKIQLVKAQERMKSQADKKRSDISFMCVEWVFVKLRAHRQQSVVTRINAKLAAKYYGPYPIIERVGAVAYKLKLPEGSRVHPVFHVSLLKKPVGNYQEDTELPDLLEEQVEGYEPEAVLATRKVKQHGKEVKQLLIHWKGKIMEEATWEEELMIRSQFPKFDLEDKVHFDGGGIDRTQTNEEAPHQQLIHSATSGAKLLLVYSRRKGRLGNNG